MNRKKIVTLLFLVGLILKAAPATPAPVADVFPPALGDVILQGNADAPFHLYVVAIGHADVVTGKENPEGADLRREIREIGRWLLRNRNVGTIFPEGFFETVPGTRRSGDTRPEVLRASGRPEDRLSVESGIPLRQCEDEEIYQRVNETLHALENCRENPYETFVQALQLEYFQRRRTLSIMKKVLAVLLDEQDTGAGPPRCALLTIGAAHLPHIADFVVADPIVISPPPATDPPHEEIRATLPGLGTKVGLTVIVPNRLRSGPAAAVLAETEFR